jgi:Protein of unknown function, DUF488
MSGLFRDHEPTHNTTQMRFLNRGLDSKSASILFRSVGCAVGSGDVRADVNAFWQNQRFHYCANYAMSEDFHSGLIRLPELRHARRCAIMCAEAVWWRCHRRIIADYLMAAGETVFHILGRNHIEQAHMTDGAKPGPVGTLAYTLDARRPEKAKTIKRRRMTGCDDRSPRVAVGEQRLAGTDGWACLVGLAASVVRHPGARSA